MRKIKKFFLWILVISMIFALIPNKDEPAQEPVTSGEYKALSLLPMPQEERKETKESALGEETSSKNDESSLAKEYEAMQPSKEAPTAKSEEKPDLNPVLALGTTENDSQDTEKVEPQTDIKEPQPEIEEPIVEMAEESEVQEEPKVQYIGNGNTYKFHRLGCSSINQMAEHNKVELYSREEAISYGYVPCKRCNP